MAGLADELVDEPRGQLRVLLAEDQPLVRTGFATLVAAEEDMVLVGAAVDGLEAVELARTARPDVVLMDVRMPRLDGVAATRRILADPEMAGTRVLVLTTFDLDRYVYDALRSGASGFLLKDTDPAMLLDAVRRVARGDLLFAPTVTRRLVDAYVTRPAPTVGGEDPLRHLTPRETDVLALVARGRDNDEIAESLRMSPLTAKTHVSRLLAKLGAHSRAQLVVTAYEAGLVSPGDAG